MKHIQPKGNSYDGSNQYKEKQNHTLTILGIIILISGIIGIIYYLNTRFKICTATETLILTRASEYVKEKNLLPKIEGESISITVEELFTNHARPMVDENTCSGTITYTNYKGNHIMHYDITNCGKCTTQKRFPNWSKEQNKFPEDKKNIQVIPYYNYYEVSVYNSEWSKWIESAKITEKNKKFNITLPKEQLLPRIPEEGVILRYEKEEQTYYSYRDKKYRFYKDNGGTYSDYSKEQPAGYSKCDYQTVKESDWTDWSLDYPEKKNYRTIESTTGYRWYYLKNDKKIYWNSGTYTPKQPNQKYNKKESKTVQMYRYRDKSWRWYNGEKREYSSLMVEPKYNYTIKDTGYSEYTNWSNFSPSSKIDNTNKAYREEKKDIYTRFRKVYQMKTFLRLNTYISKQDFEEKMKQPVPELMKNENLLIDIRYKFKYRTK